MRGRAASLGEPDLLSVVEAEQPVALHPMDHLRHRGRRDTQEFREPCADDLATLVGERVDGLEVLLGRRRGDGGRRHAATLAHRRCRQAAATPCREARARSYRMTPTATASSASCTRVVSHVGKTPKKPMSGRRLPDVAGTMPATCNAWMPAPANLKAR